MNNKRKKGQIAGQIFTYMMAVIIIGVIIIIGYKAVSSITGKACDAERANFKNSVVEYIEKYNSYGSINRKIIKVPCDYDTVCFVSTADIGAANPFSCTDSRIIQDSVNNGASENIFVISDGYASSIGYSDLISLGPTYNGECLCIDSVNGKFDIKFSGKGSSTEISKGS